MAVTQGAPRAQIRGPERSTRALLQTLKSGAWASVTELLSLQPVVAAAVAPAALAARGRASAWTAAVAVLGAFGAFAPSCRPDAVVLGAAAAAAAKGGAWRVGVELLAEPTERSVTAVASACAQTGEWDTWIAFTLRLDLFAFSYKVIQVFGDPL